MRTPTLDAAPRFSLVGGFSVKTEMLFHACLEAMTESFS